MELRNATVWIGEGPDGTFLIEVQAGDQVVRVLVQEGEYEEVIKRRIQIRGGHPDEGEQIQQQDAQGPDEKDEAKEDAKEEQETNKPRRVRIVRVDKTLLAYYPRRDVYAFVKVGKPGRTPPIQKTVAVHYVRDVTRMLRMGNPENVSISVYSDEIGANMHLFDVLMKDYLNELLGAWKDYEKALYRKSRAEGEEDE